VEGDVDSDSGMVVDFSDVKSPIVEAFDHNLILNKNDPILTARELLEDHQQKEFYLIDGEPTAENIAEKALDIILSFLPEDDRRRIQRITLELKETPNSKVTTERVIDNER
jgi:6-pyruvoyl-tetrahydropterin synthase